MSFPETWMKPDFHRACLSLITAVGMAALPALAGEGIPHLATPGALPPGCAAPLWSAEAIQKNQYGMVSMKLLIGADGKVAQYNLARCLEFGIGVDQDSAAAAGWYAKARAQGVDQDRVTMMLAGTLPKPASSDLTVVAAKPAMVWHREPVK
jgi:TPR repeat protein